MRGWKELNGIGRWVLGRYLIFIVAKGNFKILKLFKKIQKEKWDNIYIILSILYLLEKFMRRVICKKITKVFLCKEFRIL